MQIDKRKIVSAAKTLVVSVIQIITYVAICEFALYILGRLFPRSGDIGWGIMYRCSIVLISLLIVVGNFISAGYFRNKLKPSIIVSCSTLTIFVLYLLPGYSYTPYRKSIALFRNSGILCQVFGKIEYETKNSSDTLCDPASPINDMHNLFRAMQCCLGHRG